MKQLVELGVDLGNFDTKTQDTILPNGYTEHTILPSMAKEYLFYNNKYYCPNEKRFNYMEDKTASERALILSLFGISKQLIFRAKQKKKKTEQEIQEEIESVKEILLGIGLPLTHMSKGKENIAYFEKYLKPGISYEYCGYQFSFCSLMVQCFPQNFAAIATNAEDEIIKGYKKFYAADLGGGTMDLLPFINGKPDVSGCTTDNVGILYMYKHIAQSIKRDFNLTLKDEDIADVLTGQRSVISPDVKKEIKRLVRIWVDEEIVNRLSQNGVNFETSFIIFFGGGALLLKSYLNSNLLLKNIHFLRNPVKANAKGYAIMVKKIYQEQIAL